MFELNKTRLLVRLSVSEALFHKVGPIYEK